MKELIWKKINRPLVDKSPPSKEEARKLSNIRTPTILEKEGGNRKDHKSTKNWDAKSSA